MLEDQHTSAHKPAAEQHVRIESKGAAGIVVLDRPRALNALDSPMRSRIAAAFPRFARDVQIYAVIIKSTSPKAFSAGGDIRELTGLEAAEARRSLEAEYALVWLLECFSKPTVSFIDGLVMGGGVGLSLFGTHRVAAEGYRFAMPETAIGFFPDDGVSSIFARMPDHVGVYLGLTGRTIGRADAYALGLATHCIARDRLAEIEAGLADAEPVDLLLDARHQDPGPGELEALRPVIARCFGAPTVEGILARLEQEVAEGSPAAGWCQSVIDDLAVRSPVSLKVTLQHIRTAGVLDLRQTLIRDFRIAATMLDGHDFHEGVRAVLVDKGRRANWRPASLADVTDAIVERHFMSRPGAELVLAMRQEMQAARV